MSNGDLFPLASVEGPGVIERVRPDPREDHHHASQRGHGEVVSGLPTDALVLAGRQIEKVLEEKPLDEETLEAAFR